MPGPANEKGRKKRLNKKKKAKKNETNVLAVSPETHVQTPPESVSRVDKEGPKVDTRPETPKHSTKSTIPATQARIDVAYTPIEDDGYRERHRHADLAVYDDEEDENVDHEAEAQIAHLESSASYIYDPGNGPRVRDFLAFLKSPFAAPVAQSFLHVGVDPGSLRDIQSDAAEQKYSAANIIPVLNRFLPGEFATLLWFNRTRKTQRICPACQRLYNLADDLPPLIMPAQGEAPEADPEGIRRERELSGICSLPCFALATYNYGPAAVWAYGLMLPEIDEDALDAIESGGSGVDDQGLSTYVRMTRYDGSGLLEFLSNALGPR